MDWMVNDGLYKRFLKWQLKHENTLDYELVMLSETRKCKKGVSLEWWLWSWSICVLEYSIWRVNIRSHMEEVWRILQTTSQQSEGQVWLVNKLQTRGMYSVDECYNAVQTLVALAKYHQETAQILQRDIFWFFLNDESFVSKTLNEGHVELNKFPASTVCQLAKKFESSQATAKHIKQVTRDPQAVQVNLLWHQCTELSPSKSMRQKKKKLFKFRQEATKHFQNARKPQEKSRSDPECTDRCHKSGDFLQREGLDVQQQSTNVKFVRRLATAVACATRRLRKEIIIKGPCGQAYPRHTS